MPTAPIEVDTETYLSAGDLFLQVNDATCDVVSALATAIGTGGGMAGTDSGGADWARGYDEAAASALNAGATLADALGRVGDLLTVSGGNHAGAETASTPGGPPSYPGTVDPTASRAVAVLPAAPPSANGTDDDPPAGWFLVAHLLQFVWPNGHQDRLRAVAGGWSTASTAVSDEADRLTRAIGDVSMLRSPEVDAAVTTCCDVQRSARDLALHYATLGTACSDYADHLDEAHAAVIDELADFAIESAAIQTAGALAAAVTFGAAEVAGQVAQAARTALAAARIGRILQKLLDVVRAVTAAVRAVLSRIADVLRTVKAVLAKGGTQALERASQLPQLSQLRRISTPLRQLEDKYKHAGAFGVTLPRGRAGFDAFGKALTAFVRSPTTIRVSRPYRGDPAILNYDPVSRLAVVQQPTGEFVTAWKMTPGQWRNVVNGRSLGGS